MAPLEYFNQILGLKMHYTVNDPTSYKRLQVASGWLVAFLDERCQVNGMRLSIRNRMALIVRETHSHVTIIIIIGRS